MVPQFESQTARTTNPAMGWNPEPFYKFRHKTFDNEGLSTSCTEHQNRRITLLQSTTYLYNVNISCISGDYLQNEWDASCCGTRT
jgi:hypothetical protein